MARYAAVPQINGKQIYAQEQNDCWHSPEIWYAGDCIINPNLAFNPYRGLAWHQIFPSQEEFYPMDVALHICLGNRLCPLFWNFHSSLTLQDPQNAFCLLFHAGGKFFFQNGFCDTYQLRLKIGFYQRYIEQKLQCICPYGNGLKR